MLPISSKPFINGAVAVVGTKIVAVGDVNDVTKQFPDAEIEEHGDAAILPGFVNCHSHLEITSMRGALDSVEHDFRSWLLTLNGLRAKLSEEEIEEAAFRGALEGVAAGVTCFGDIGRYGRAGLNALKRAGLRGIVFQETEFSPDNRTADDDFIALAAKYEKLREDADEFVSVGLSPHSPYTVSSRLFELIAQYSIINNVPLSIHAAESDSEMLLLTKGEGFFTEVYERFDVEWQSPHCTPIEYLEKLGVLSARPLLAHCVKVNESDVAKIAANGAAIAHCPRSNAKFGHGYAPFERFLKAGISVGFGSDSVASNNACDLIEESRHAAFAARNHPERDGFMSHGDVLKAVTLGGAEAMGMAAKIGSLEPGKDADLAVVALDHIAQQPVNDVEAAIVFSSNARDVIATYVAGEKVFTT